MGHVNFVFTQNMLYAYNVDLFMEKKFISPYAFILILNFIFFL